MTGKLPTIDAALAEALRSSSDRKAVARAHLTESRRAVGALHLSGATGGEVVARWTAAVDRLVVALFDVLVGEAGLPRPGLALFGLGGYGRSELSPCSDLDLLLLHPGDSELQALLEGLLYPLWDAGLDVQCVARTPAENLAAARADLKSRTSLLEGRCLWDGGGGAAARYEREMVRGEIFGHGVRDFVEAKLSEMEARHQRYGDTVYLLEPNVKEGPGGLRDVQTALWVAKVRFKVTSARDLVSRAVVPEAELDALAAAHGFLLRVRNGLHLAAGRREDRLTFEAQDQLAPALGYRDEGDLTGVERFLQDYYATANRVGHFGAVVIRRVTAGLLPRSVARPAPPQTLLPGVVLRGGELHLLPEAVQQSPLLLLEVFEASQAHDADLSPGALGVVRENLHRVDDRFRRDPEAVDCFFRILRNPRRVATTLLRMHDVHLLDRFIPEFGRIFCRLQRDLYHAYPVDVHSLFAVQELRRLTRAEGEAEFPFQARIMGGLARPHILYLAALLHDVGKGQGGGHERRGAEIAVAVADRMGLEPADREYLVFLVREHLSLAHTAQGRDLHDEELVRSFARGMGDLEALKMLYLLTFADVRAVGPGAWSNWKDLLFRELFEKAAEVLETGTFEQAVLGERARSVEEQLREEAERLHPPLATEEVEAFLRHSEGAPYLLSNPLEALLRHLRLYASRAEEPSVELRHVPGEGYTEVLLLTRDRTGLFADVAGLLTAHRLNVLSAVLHTRSDGWILDVLHVCGPQGEVVTDEGRWQRWKGDLVDVLSGRKGFDAVAGHRLARRSGLRRRRPGGHARIRVDNEASRRFTVLDISAADRLGLLYDIVRVFAERGLSIRLAKIATNLHQVSDSFYVASAEGGKITAEAELAALEAALAAVVSEEAPC